MGCGGCELFPSPGTILTQIDVALAAHHRVDPGQARKQFRKLIDESFSQILSPSPGHSRAISTTNIWHVRLQFIDATHLEFGREAADEVELVINRAIACYAAKLHLNKARSILNPTRGANPGYAPTFERSPGSLDVSGKWRDPAICVAPRTRRNLGWMAVPG